MTNNQSEKIVEEFDEKFPKSRHTSDIYPREELKTFLLKAIDSVRKAERERLKGLIESMIPGELREVDRVMVRLHESHDSAVKAHTLEEIQALLQEEPNGKEKL